MIFNVTDIINKYSEDGIYFWGGNMSHSDDSYPGGPIFHTVPYNYFGGKLYALCENLLLGNTP